MEITGKYVTITIQFLLYRVYNFDSFPDSEESTESAESSIFVLMNLG